ncbi:MAG: hypothetical protein HY317_02405 [Acidobacteria bacterium]|nr:hypothetical protein [Acidobacteriota bacterium]
MPRAALASLVAAVLTAGSAGALADEVLLKNGGRLTGVVVEHTPTMLTLDVGPGRLSLPRSRVERILAGGSSLATFRERARHLAEDDAEGWLALALWAQEGDLLTQAREAFERVLAVDPRNAVARRGIGHVLFGDRWMTAEDSYRARGWVEFEGRWMTPDEHAAVLRARAEQLAAERSRVEADARAREAEARARTAEAEARRADTAAWGPVVPGILGPVPVAAVGGFACCRSPLSCPHRRGSSPPAAVTVPQPPPPPPMRDGPRTRVTQRWRDRPPTP